MTGKQPKPVKINPFNLRAEYVNLGSYQNDVMKYITILLSAALLFAGIGAQAQEGSGRHLGRPNPKQKGPAQPSKYKIEQFDGRWQETSRQDSKTKAPVNIEDTFYIRFYDGTRADTKQGSSVVVTGYAEVSKDDYVTTSASDFKIVSLSANEMVLDDEAGDLHTFTKTDKFAYEAVITPPVAAPDTATAVVDLSPAAFTKNWFAYRRGANPGVITNQTYIIRELKITGNTGDNNYKGEIQYSHTGAATVKPCTITISGNTATITTDVNTWNVTVYKCDGQELILGKKGELVYYFKNSN